MAGGGGQQPGQGDNSAGILWGIAALFAAIGVVATVFKHQIFYFYLTIKLYEVDLMNAVTRDHYHDLHDNILYALSITNNLTYSDLMLIGQSVGSVIRFPLMVILLILAVVVYVGNSARVFRNTYSMNDLANHEKVNWPQISPTIKLNLLKTDIDTGPWAMSMQPMPFCKHYRLLEEVRPQRVEGMARKDWDRVDVVLRRGEANRVFALQLGPLWMGPDKIPPYARALFAVFAARINSDSKAAADILSQLSATSTSKLDYRGVDALLKKHEGTKLVQKVIQGHAYFFTVMAAMLEAARQDGVQASCDFLWLKPVDRKLWYTLNTVGRQTPFAEIAGIFAHWVAEKEAGRKLFTPMVEEATKALEIALKEIVYKPDEK